MTVSSPSKVAVCEAWQRTSVGKQGGEVEDDREWKCRNNSISLHFHLCSQVVSVVAVDEKLYAKVRGEFVSSGP